MTRTNRLRADVEFLCSPECDGRAPGTSGGHIAADYVESRMKEIGLMGAGEYGFRQDIPPIDGTNILGALDGTGTVWVVFVAHFDHLGSQGSDVYWGANDNASGVAVMLEVARTLAARDVPLQRSVLFASFDAEEPPFFLGPTMGSQWFVDHPTIPKAEIDLMICLDIVGSAIGPDSLPSEVGESIFVQGAETSDGATALIDALPSGEGIRPRHITDWLIPPMSDHDAFRAAQIPWVFYYVGRDINYHQPSDTPDTLDYTKMAALSRHLEHLVESAANRPGHLSYLPEPAGDSRTLQTLTDLLEALSPFHDDAAAAIDLLDLLKSTLDSSGRLPEENRAAVGAIVNDLEQRLGGV